MTDQPRWLAYDRLDDLVGAPANPKAHDPSIAASLRRFGYVEAITVDERTGRLVAGHGRVDDLRAKRAAGEEPPDGVLVADDGTWTVPVQHGWESANDGEAAAYVLVSNQSTIAGGWDQEALDALTAELAAMDVDLSDLGFDSTTLIHVDEHDRTPPEPRDPDEVEHRVSPGDVWGLGPHRLMCGDCRNPGDVDTLLDGVAVNLAFTSPPYADRRTYDETTTFRAVPPDEYVAWFEPVAANVAAHLAEDGSWMLNMKEHCEDGQRVLYVKDLTIEHARRWAWMFVDEFCWTRNSVPGGWPNRFKNAWEPVFHFTRQAAIKFRPEAVAVETEAAFDYAPDNPKSETGFFSKRGRPDIAHPGMARPSNVLRIGAETGQTGNHSAPFPVHLPAWFVRAYTDEGDVVYDPFVGSGSTILAAAQHDRVGYGMEISPGYCDVILDRWERHGGTAPVLLDRVP